MIKKEKILILFIVLTFSIFGCSKSGDTNADKVIAEVGEETITMADLDEFTAQIPPFAKKSYQGEEGKLRLLEQLVEKRLVVQAAKDLGYEEDDLVKERVTSTRERAIKKQYYTKEYLSKIKIKEEEIKQYYEDHKEDFIKSARADVYHIQLDTQSEAEKVLNQLKNGASFEELAKKYSTDEMTGKKGGDIGSVFEGRPIPRIGRSEEFSQVVFSLESGEYSDTIVETDKGYHIIKVENKTERSYKSLDQVREKVEHDLIRERREALYEEWQAEMEDEYDIKLYEDKIPEAIPMDRELTDDENVVIGKIKREKIRLSELQDFLKSRNPSAQRAFTGKEKIIDLWNDYLFEILRLKEGIKKGYDEDPFVIKEVEFNKEQGTLQAYYENEIRQKAEVPEEDMKDYYIEHPDEFHGKERVDTYVIVLEDEEKALDAKEKLENGADFQELAKEISIDETTKEEGGHLGWVSRRFYAAAIGQDSQKISEAALALSPGEISDPIETQKGYMLLTITERKDAGTLPFEEVKDRIRNIILPAYSRKKLMDTVEELKEKYPVKIYEDRLIDPEKVVKELFNKAQEYQAMNKPQAALECYDEIIEKMPDTAHSYKAQFMIGYVYSEIMEDYDNAEDAYKKVLKYDEGDLHDDAKYMLDDLEKRKKSGKSELTTPVEEKLEQRTELEDSSE